MTVTAMAAAAATTATALSISGLDLFRYRRSKARLNLLHEHGQLGNGAVADSNTPVPVSFLDEADVNALAAGDTHTMAPKRYGAVWA